MSEDKGWFARQASRTADDIKQFPPWLRTQFSDSRGERGDIMTEQKNVRGEQDRMSTEQPDHDIAVKLATMMAEHRGMEPCADFDHSGPCEKCLTLDAAIKALSKSPAASSEGASLAEQGKACCSWCDWHQCYVVGTHSQANAEVAMRAHVKTCESNPNRVDADPASLFMRAVARAEAAEQRLAEVTRERDELLLDRHQRDRVSPCGHYRVFAMPCVLEDGSERPSCMQCDRDAAQDRADAAEATIASLRDALRTFGEHKRSCATRSTSTEMWPKCNCGLAAALAAPAAAVPPEIQPQHDCGLRGRNLTDPPCPACEALALGELDALVPLPGAAAISKDEAIGIICGLADMQAGRVTSLSAIDAKAGAGTEQTDPDDLTLSPGDPRYLSPEAQIARLDHLIAYVQAHAPDTQVEAWLRARRDTVRAAAETPAKEKR